MEYRSFKKGKERNGDTAILIQISNCDGVLLEIYFGSQIPVTTGQFELRGIGVDDLIDGIYNRSSWIVFLVYLWCDIKFWYS